MANRLVILTFLVDVEHSHVRFLGNLGKHLVKSETQSGRQLNVKTIFFLPVLNLWDCGGQESFMEQYFASQKDNIFRNVEVLIYVFDVESRELDNDMHYYQSCLEAIYKVLYHHANISITNSLIDPFIHRIHPKQRYSA